MTTTMSELELGKQMRMLQDEAETDMQECYTLLAQAKEKKDKHDEKLRQLAQLATKAVETPFQLSPTANLAAPPQSNPAPAAKKGPAKKTKTGKSGRINGQNTTLRKEIWDITGRSASAHRQYFPEYPAGASGLKAAEIEIVINKEGKWKSSSEDIYGQIQTCLGILKKDGKIKRDPEDRRYTHVAGATL